MNLKNEKIGMIFDPSIPTKNFSKNMSKFNITPFKIVDYINNKDVEIEFLDENHYHLKHKNFNDLKRNRIKNPFSPSLLNIAYLGDKTDIYPTSVNGNMSLCYKRWMDMIRRCYDEEYHKRYPAYKDCKVYYKWLNYSNFAEWYYKNFYEIEGELTCLDKDILFKNNKMYSPKRCIFVPDRINKFYIAQQKITNSHVGVFKLPNGKYRARLYYKDDNGNKLRTEKIFSSEKEALDFYLKNKKKNEIRLAKRYKEKFILQYGKEAFNSNKFKFKKLYKTMIKREVD